MQPATKMQKQRNQSSKLGQRKFCKTELLTLQLSALRSYPPTERAVVASPPEASNAEQQCAGGDHWSSCECLSEQENQTSPAERRVPKWRIPKINPKLKTALKPCNVDNQLVNFLTNRKLLCIISSYCAFISISEAVVSLCVSIPA